MATRFRASALPVTSTALLALTLLAGGIGASRADDASMFSEVMMPSDQMSVEQRYTQYYRALTVAELCEGLSWRSDPNMVTAVGNAVYGGEGTSMVSGIKSDSDGQKIPPGQTMSGTIGNLGGSAPDASTGQEAFNNQSAQKMSGSTSMSQAPEGDSGAQAGMTGAGGADTTGEMSGQSGEMAMGTSTGETTDNASMSTGSSGATEADNYGPATGSAFQQTQKMSGSGGTAAPSVTVNKGFPLMQIEEAKSDGRKIVEQKGCESQEAQALLNLAHTDLGVRSGG